MTEQQRENIGRLIEKVSRRTSTEDLIAFVADNFGMLHACQKVVEFKEIQDAAARTWFEQKCRDFRILPQVLEKECERLLSIFQPGLAQDEQYSLLDLTPLASIAEVKSAYHKLSFRYHPDSGAAAASGDQDNSEKFIAICRAYKKITQAQETLNAGVDAENIPWQKEFRPRISKRRQQKRKAFFLITAIAVCLLIVSFSATRSYRNKAMLKSLGQSSGTAVAKSRPQPVPVAVPAAPEIKAKPEKPVQVAAVTPPPVPVKVAAATSPLPKVHKVKKTVPPAPVKVAAVIPPAPIVVPAPKPKPVPKPVKVATVAVVKKPTPVVLPLRDRVNTFLSAYTDTYEMLNFNAFAAFFADDARENDTIFKQRASKYHKLFGLLKEVSYTIKPHSLRTDNNLVYVSGHFRASLLYRDGRELKIHGPTTLLLREDPSHHFKVKNLTYTFD